MHARSTRGTGHTHRSKQSDSRRRVGGKPAHVCVCVVGEVALMVVVVMVVRINRGVRGAPTPTPVVTSPAKDWPPTYLDRDLLLSRLCHRLLLLLVPRTRHAHGLRLRRRLRHTDCLVELLLGLDRGLGRADEPKRRSVTRKWRSNQFSFAYLSTRYSSAHAMQPRGGVRVRARTKSRTSPTRPFYYYYSTALILASLRQWSRCLRCLAFSCSTARFTAISRIRMYLETWHGNRSESAEGGSGGG